MAVIYDMSRVDAMEGHEFEHFIANLLRKLGYQKVEVTPGSGDQGVDVLAEKDGVRYAIQCKCYSSDLGNTPIQEINTGKMVYHCHVGVVVTNRYFTQSAREAAKATGVLLWDRSKLTDLLAQAQMEIGTEIPVQHKEETLSLWSGSPLGSIALKDRDWKRAHQFFDRVLNSDPENAEAYLGLVMAEAELPDQPAFVQTYISDAWRLRGNNFHHMKEFAGPELKAWFTSLDIQRQKKEAKVEAQRKRKEAEAEAERKRKEFEAEERRQQAAAERYAAAKEQEQIMCDSREPDAMQATAQILRATAQKFRSLGSYQDSLQRAESCEQRAACLEEEADAEVAVRAEQERLRNEEKRQLAEKQKRKRKRIAISIFLILAVVVVIGIGIKLAKNAKQAEQERQEMYNAIFATATDSGMENIEVSLEPFQHEGYTLYSVTIESSNFNQFSYSKMIATEKRLQKIFGVTFVLYICESDRYEVFADDDSETVYLNGEMVYCDW